MTEDRIGKEISGSMHRRFPSRKRGPIQYGWVLFSNSCQRKVVCEMFTSRPTLIAAMIVGRLVWGCVQFMMAGLQHTVFDRSLFLAGAVTNALPGILVQIILIPILVITMEKAKLTLNGTR